MPIMLGEIEQIVSDWRPALQTAETQVHAGLLKIIQIHLSWGIYNS